MNRSDLLTMLTRGDIISWRQWFMLRHFITEGPNCIVAHWYSCGLTEEDHNNTCFGNPRHALHRCVEYDGVPLIN